MSRPKPTILLEDVSLQDKKADQILESQGIWAVLYDGKPFNLKSVNLHVSYPGPKYKKVAFSNPGHAINLAKKLNKQFKTDLFEVVLLNQGETIYSKKTDNSSGI